MFIFVLVAHTYNMNMKKSKTAGAVTVAILVIATFAVVGICVSTFLLPQKRIQIKNVYITTVEGIDVLSDAGDVIDTFSLQIPALGLKPSDAHADANTHIPYGVTDAHGSDGAYTTFSIRAEKAYVLRLASVHLSCGTEYASYVCVAIKGEDEGVKTLADKNSILASGDPTTHEEAQKYSLLIWLSPDAPESMAGAEISFTLRAEELTS